MPLKLYVRDGIYHYRGSVAGRRLRVSTKTAHKETAQRIAAEAEAREWKRDLDGPEAVLTFAQAAILYRKAGKPDRFLERIEDHWKDTPVRKINNGAVRKAALVLYPEASAATRNRQVIVPTQAIINHAASLDLCRSLKVVRYSVTKKEKQPATWEWVQQFMAVSSPHLGALACFMFLTGARITEALSLTWADVDLSTGRALVRQTKIGAERRPHLPPALVAALANILSNRNPDDSVFGYSSRDTAKFPWRAACKRAKIASLSFHACRHGFATAMLHRRIDPITVAKLGGWKSPAHLFATYGHAMEDDTLSDLITDTPVTRAKKTRQKA